jgi:AcrR family transcriptional regulator
MMKTDRRVQRTRELLQKALIELISERGYDALTIQDIVDHANVGRTTFYLH